MFRSNTVVIGAGMAGLTVAKYLHDQDISVTIFEKARGSGGRLSSKAIPLDHENRITFDLGCTHFEAKTQAFRQLLSTCSQQNTVATWPYSTTHSTNYVGLPRNSALTRSLAKGLSVNFGVRITQLTKKDHIWQLWQADSENINQALIAEAEHVVLAIPPEQAMALLPDNSDIKQSLGEQECAYLTPQWVMGLVLNADTQTVNNLSDMPPVWTPDNTDVVDQVTQEHHKPERSQTPVLQVQASVPWTESRLDWSKDMVAKALLQALSELLPTNISLAHQALYVHRWLYSCVPTQHQKMSDTFHTDQHKNRNTNERTAFLSSNNGLHVCGDYFLATHKYDGVESAFLSGQAMAEHITHLCRQQTPEQV